MVFFAACFRVPVPCGTCVYTVHTAISLLGIFPSDLALLEVQPYHSAGSDNRLLADRRTYRQTRGVVAYKFKNMNKYIYVRIFEQKKMYNF